MLENWGKWRRKPGVVNGDIKKNEELQAALICLVHRGNRQQKWQYILILRGI